ncbi:MAG: hypothetical protein RIT27_87 [Pseudomonadota bacterium]
MKVKDKDVNVFILRALAWDANDKGESTLSIPNIAAQSNRSQRAIQTAMRNLEADGKVGIQYQQGHATKDGKTNRYFLNDFRVSIGLKAVITESPYKSKAKPSPRAISKTQAVKFDELGGEAICTHTHTNQQFILNTNTVCHNPVYDKESALQMDVKRPLDYESAGTIENQVEKQPQHEPVRSTVCSSVEKEFFNEKNDLVFPSDLHSQEEKQTAFKMLVQNNIPQTQWQIIFDEFEGKTIWKHKRGEQMPNKMGYLYGMIKNAAQGKFNPESAKVIAKQRQQQLDSQKSLTQKVNDMAKNNSSQKIEVKQAIAKTSNPQIEAIVSEINQATSRTQLQQTYFKIQNSSIHPNDKNYLANIVSKNIMEIRA